MGGLGIGGGKGGGDGGKLGEGGGDGGLGGGDGGLGGGLGGGGAGAAGHPKILNCPPAWIRLPVTPPTTAMGVV